MSQTLLGMASLITSELGVYDDTSVALTKDFLNKEYHTLWDKYPWGDTEIFETVTIEAGADSVPLPLQIDRIIAIRARDSFEVAETVPPAGPPVGGAPVSPSTYRSNARFLDPVTIKFLIETNPSYLRATGYVQYFNEANDMVTGVKSINCFPLPVVDTELGIHGKAVCPGLLADTDQAVIRNIDGALIAYATAWMLRRQRQYGKADIEYKRGQELETVAWNLEQQQANQPRQTKSTTVAGNSLAEMTDAVCMLCGQWAPEYRLMIREFLRRNYQALYDLYLWPESLVTVLMTYFSEQVILPYYIDRVLAVRSPGQFGMTQMDGPVLFQLNPSVFEQTGEPLTYTLLTPVGVSILPNTTTQLVLASTSDVDVSNVAVRGEVIAGGSELEETVTLQGTTPVTTQYAYDIPITVAKEITAGNVTINAANDYTLLGQLRYYLREKKHQRLWLLPPLSDTDNDGTKKIMVMGKRAILPLVSDEDTPIITGAQQVLIAAAAADVFRKLEKPDQAAAFMQKASGSTDALKAKNTDQAASSPRFVPQVEAHAYVAGGVGGCIW